MIDFRKFHHIIKKSTYVAKKSYFPAYNNSSEYIQMHVEHLIFDLFEQRFVRPF